MSNETDVNVEELNTLKKFWEEQFGLASQTEWNGFLAEVESMTNATDTIRGVKTEYDAGLKAGQLMILDWITARRDMASKAVDSIEAELEKRNA